MTTDQFRVPEISCQHCVNAITKEVSAVPGVKQVIVNLADKTVQVDHEANVAAATLIKAVQRGVQSTDKPQLLRTAHYRQTADEKRRYHDLEKKRNRHATDLSIDPTIIASRADLVQLARVNHNGEPPAAELMAWQRELLK